MIVSVFNLLAGPCDLPDKGGALRYDASLPASACLDNDLRLLIRMRDLLA